MVQAWRRGPLLTRCCAPKQELPSRASKRLGGRARWTRRRCDSRPQQSVEHRRLLFENRRHLVEEPLQLRGLVAGGEAHDDQGTTRRNKVQQSSRALLGGPPCVELLNQFAWKRPPAGDEILRVVVLKVPLTRVPGAGSVIVDGDVDMSRARKRCVPEPLSSQLADAPAQPRNMRCVGISALPSIRVVERPHQRAIDRIWG